MAGRIVPPVLGGLLVGGVIALVLAMAAERFLFGIRPQDPATFAVLAVLLAGVASVAALLPARRATWIDPAETLRSE